MPWTLIVRVLYAVSAVASGWGLWVMRRDMARPWTAWDWVNVALAVTLPCVNTLDAVLFGIAIHRTRKRQREATESVYEGPFAESMREVDQLDALIRHQQDAPRGAGKK